MGFTRRLVWPAAAMAGVAGILGVLAVLQYRWTTQISDSEHERMRTQLRTAIGQFRQDFYRELVTNVYVWDMRAPEGHQELKLNRESGAFADGGFPDEVKKALKSAPWRAPGGTLRRIPWTFDATPPGMVRPVYRFRTGWNSGREEGGGRAWRERSHERERSQSQEESAPGSELVGVTVVELNSSFLVHQLFPALVQRHLNLSGTTYHVAIFSTVDPAHPIFESGPTPVRTADDKPDAELSLVESPFVQNRAPGQRPRQPGDPPPPDPLRQSPVLRRYAMAFPAALIPGRANWRLAAQHPAGSLKAAVDTTRRANLMMSFGALVILFGSSSLLFAAIHRTRAL